MQVEQIMTKQVTACGPDTTLDRAAQLMWENDCGCLPVRAADGSGGRVAGVITDRDICMAALFQGRPLRELRVADAMSRQLFACRPDDAVVDVERTMREGQVRRLPVVDEQGSLVGMVTLADLARAAEREQTLQRPSISGQEISTTLASICQPPNHQLAA